MSTARVYVGNHRTRPTGPSPGLPGGTGRWQVWAARQQPLCLSAFGKSSSRLNGGKGWLPLVNRKVGLQKQEVQGQADASNSPNLLPTLKGRVLSLQRGRCPSGIRKYIHRQLEGFGGKLQSSSIYYGDLESSDPSQTFISDPLHLWVWYGHLAPPHQEQGRARKLAKLTSQQSQGPESNKKHGARTGARQLRVVIGGSYERLDGHPLCPGLCVAVLHRQLCAALSAGEGWILVRVRAVAAHAHSLNLTLSCFVRYFVFYFSFNKIKSNHQDLFFGKVIRVLFYTVLKKYNFLLFELKITTQHFKPTLSSTYSKVMA